MTMPQEGYLKTNTMFFAEHMCQSINDMVGVPCQINIDTLKEDCFKPAFKMITFISFSGIIQGNYICALDEITALKIIGAYTEGMSDEEIKEQRGDYSGFVKEVLNLSVGQSIVELEKNFGELTFSPSTLVYGELEFPDFSSGNIVIESEFGNILCGFSLNLANLRIGQQLEEALGDLKVKSAEALEAKKNISSILELLPVGLVAIDQAGIVLPGHSKSTQAVIGLNSESAITGVFLPDVLQLEGDIGQSWKNWLDLVFSRFGVIPFRDLASLCDLNNIVNVNKRNLKLDWLPITNDTGGQLEKLLVVIEDITKQRELETKMEEINEKHQENLELISQVINLGPDEVTDFIYDSSELLSDAQKIVEGNNRDREFVNDLFRTFHTLKGSSGQYQFKSMQEMAHKLEDHLKEYRNDSGSVDDVIVDEVKTSIESAKSYLNRIQDIRLKLGGKDVPLKTKARRDPSTIMVNLNDVNVLQDRWLNLITKGKAVINDNFYIRELEDFYESLTNLKKIRLSFFLSSLEMLVKNSSEKIGKKVTISIGNDIAIDVEIMRLLHQCFLHMINNAIDHGIETPEERLTGGKIENGVLVISGSKLDNKYMISFEDDGRGIDLAAVREKVIESFKIPQEQVYTFSDQELYAFLFKPGFTTKKTTTILSGRGVGMDFIHNTLSKLQGTVRVESTEGKGTKVTLVLPVEVK